ncbi:MAG: PD-(D/E)XK nuclease-like domain-containing protein, partial [Acidimicrobiia bacterium]|nr:PD-(D/E)XK nuclease-like domain-containing protein [Acidimicrobiia bacterium]
MIEFPALTVGPDITISASSYVAYRQCPDRALARFRGEYGPESVPAFRGNLAHRIFARHLRDGPIDEDGFALACREEIGSSNLNYKMGELGLTPTVLRGVIEEVGALYERFRRLPGEGFQGAEVAL